MQVFKTIFGIVLVTLGPLWSLQGADLIRIKPILCVAHCEPMVGGSITWLIVGIGALAVGLGLLVSLKRKHEA